MHDKYETFTPDDKMNSEETVSHHVEPLEQEELDTHEAQNKAETDDIERDVQIEGNFFEFY